MAIKKSKGRKDSVRKLGGKTVTAKSIISVSQRKRGLSSPTASRGAQPFDFSFLLAGVCGLWSAYSYQHFQDLVSAGFFGILALALALRGVFPKWKYEKGAQNSFSWIHFIAGATAEALGVHFFCHNPPFWRIGIPLQIFAFWSLILSVPPMGETALVAPRPALKQSPRLITDNVFNLMLPLIVVAQIGIFQMQTGFGLTLAGFSVLLVLYFRFKWGEAPSKVSASGLNENLWLGAILVLAALMRLPFMGANVVGLQNDEANMIMDVMNVLNGTMQNPFGVGWGDTAAMPYYLTAIFYKVLGNHLWVARFVSTLGGLLGIFVLFKLCRLFFSPIASLLAAYFYAVSWWCLFHSLSPFNGIFTVLYCLSAFYFLETGLREGKRMNFWLAGIFTALCLDTYVPGRLVPIMVFCSLMGFLILGRLKFVKVYWKHLLLMLAGFLWLFGPTIWVIMIAPSVMTGRASELNIFNVVGQTHMWWLPTENFGRAFLAILQDPGKANDLRFDPAGNPMLDPFMSVFLIGGVVLCLTSLRNRLSWILLPGLCGAITATAFAQVTADLGYFSAIRCFLILPFALMIVARFIDWLLNLEITRRLPKNILMTCLGIMVAGSLVFNVHAYFFGWPVGQGQWEQMGFNHLLMSQQVNKYGPNRHLFMYFEDWSNPARIMAKENYPVSMFQDDTALPILYRVDKDVVFLFCPWQCPNFQKRLKEVYPNAVWNNVPNQYQAAYFIAVEVSKEDFLKAQNGQGRSDLPPDDHVK